jgi:hypothetical protein
MLVQLFVLGGIACAPDVAGVDVQTPDVDEGGLTVDGLADSGGVVRDFGLDQPRWGGLGTAVEDGPELLADSVLQYGPDQGGQGWSYGYLEPKGAAEFVEMPTWVTGGADPGWYAGVGGVYWTMVDAGSMHPNGETTTGGRQPVEQWAVRRWTSDVTGEIDVTGQFAKLSVDGESNGVAAYIYVDDVLVWAWYLEGWDDTGVTYTKRLSVEQGSIVDFALDPWEADDRSDRSRFTAQMWSVVP